MSEITDSIERSIAICELDMKELNRTRLTSIEVSQLEKVANHAYQNHLRTCPQCVKGVPGMCFSEYREKHRLPGPAGYSFRAQWLALSNYMK